MSDPLDTEVSLSFDLTKGGITGHAKSRALVALDRLVGNAVDWISVRLERAPKLRRAKDDADVAVIKALTASAVRDIKGDTSFVRRAIESQYKEVFIKQDNREAVAEEALEQLKHFPSQVIPDSGPKTLDGDWLNFFTGYAEKASSETLRAVWGGILSGEIVRPGTFSFTSLRIVSELDAPTARLFQDIASKAFGDGELIQPQASGQQFRKLMSLQDAGLIEGVAGLMTYGAGDATNSEGTPITVFPIGDIALVAAHPLKERAGTSLPIMRLTRAGRELSVLFPPDQAGAARGIARLLLPRGFTSFSIHKLVARGEDEISLQEPGEPFTP